MKLKRGLHFYLSNRRLIYLYDLLSQLVSRELKLLYKRSVLGIAWTLINPLLQLLVFYFVFHGALGLKVANYTSFVFSGLLVWNWFQSSIVEGAGVIIANRPLLRQPGFPPAILPMVVVMTRMIHFVLALPVLIVFLLIDGVSPHPVILELPILMASQFGVTVSIVYILAGINVTFRDTKYTVGVLLQILFYLTPVFYDLSNIPPTYRQFYLLNPIAHLITAYRDVLIKGVQPNWLPLIIISGLGIGLLAVGLTLFKRQSHRFVEEI